MYKKNCRQKGNNNNFFHIRCQKHLKFHYFVNFDYIRRLNDIKSQKKSIPSIHRLWIITILMRISMT